VRLQPFWIQELARTAPDLEIPENLPYFRHIHVNLKAKALDRSFLAFAIISSLGAQVLMKGNS
jgi:hypothetical protein